MQNIPDTFCPAKWDELLLNFSYNMTYACCKAEPMPFESDYQTILSQQQDNLLNGIKDSSCDYCWKPEANGGESRRHFYLKNFDYQKIEFYKNKSVNPKYLQIFIGNSCNMQCIYCSPKFSSQWEADVRKKKYLIITDRFNYQLQQKNKDLFDQNLDAISKLTGIETLNILGGEPLINNQFFKLLNNVDVDHVSFTTNLMTDKATIDRLLSYEEKFKKMTISCSIESLDDVATFVRFGIDTKIFYDNLNYLLSRKRATTKIAFQSLMTNIGIVDFKDSRDKFLKLIKDNDIVWYLHYCNIPKIFSFETLPDELRPEIIENLIPLLGENNVIGAKAIKSALEEIKFNKHIFKEFDYFIRDWEQRKNISLPDHIRKKLYSK